MTKISADNSVNNLISYDNIPIVSSSSSTSFVPDENVRISAGDLWNNYIKPLVLLNIGNQNFNTYTQMINLSPPYIQEGLIYHVIDASADPNITSGWARYRSNGDGTWQLIVSEESLGSFALTLGETDTTAYRGDRGASAYNHSLLTIGNPHNVTISQIPNLDQSLTNLLDVRGTKFLLTADTTNGTSYTISNPNGQATPAILLVNFLTTNTGAPIITIQENTGSIFKQDGGTVDAGQIPTGYPVILVNIPSTFNYVAYGVGVDTNIEIADVNGLQVELDSKDGIPNAVNSLPLVLSTSGAHSNFGNLTANYAPTLEVNGGDGRDFWRKIRIIGADGSPYTIDLSNISATIDGDTPDPTKTNVVTITGFDGVVEEVRNKVLTVDTTSPSIQSNTLDSNNAFVLITFSEEVLNSGGGNISASNFSVVNAVYTGDTTASITIGTVTDASDQAISGAIQTVKVNLVLDNPSNGNATFDIRVSNIQDAVGNVTAQVDTSPNFTLNDTSSSLSFTNSFTTGGIEGATFNDTNGLFTITTTSTWFPKARFAETTPLNSLWAIRYTLDIANSIIWLNDQTGQLVSWVGNSNAKFGALVNATEYRAVVNGVGGNTDTQRNLGVGEHVELRSIQDGSDWRLIMSYSTDDTNYVQIHDFGLITGNTYTVNAQLTGGVNSTISNIRKSF